MMRYKSAIWITALAVVVLCGLIYGLAPGLKSRVAVQAPSDRKQAAVDLSSSPEPAKAAIGTVPSQTSPTRSAKPTEEDEAAARRTGLAALEAKRKAFQSSLAASGREIDRVPVIATNLDMLMLGLSEYRQKFGEYPKGEAKDIAAALLGKLGTPPILWWPQKELGPNGELLDPWGTPISIRFDDSHIELQSAGPNRIFGDADDFKK